jgi:hypothetical protein
MAYYVKCDDTGELVLVRQVEATAVVVISSNMAGDLPSDAATRVEQAMVGAATNAHSAGIKDPDKIRELMLEARDSARIAMHNEMRDLRSHQGG